MLKSMPYSRASWTSFRTMTESSQNFKALSASHNPKTMSPKPVNPTTKPATLRPFNPKPVNSKPQTLQTYTLNQVHSNRSDARRRAGLRNRAHPGGSWHLLGDSGLGFWVSGLGFRFFAVRVLGLGFRV